MSIIRVRHIKPDIMKSVDFAENELYLRITAKVYNNVYDGEKENAPDAGTSRA